MQPMRKSFQLSKNICNHVVVGDTTSEDYRCNIRSLLEICNGPPKNSEVGFGKFLNSEDLILAILRIKKSIEYLNDEPELSVAVIKILLEFSKIPWDIVYSLTHTILLSSFVNKEELRTALWEKKGDTTSEDYRCNIRSLLEICNGPPKNSEVGFGKFLNSEDLILAILRIKKSIEYLNDEPELSVAVIKILLEFSKIPWDIVYSLTHTILLSSFVNKEELRTALWEKKGATGLPSKIWTLLVRDDSKLLENYVYDIYHNCCDLSKDVWKDKEHRWFINWCSELPEGFQISTYILNQFLIYSKFKEVLLKIIKDFIWNVMNECSKNSRDFVLLYPLEFQSVASLLVLEPSYSPLKKELEERLASLEKSNPSMVLLFYSHFPKWLEL